MNGRILTLPPTDREPSRLLALLHEALRNEALALDSANKFGRFIGPFKLNLT
jgi:hypothetical protein